LEHPPHNFIEMRAPLCCSRVLGVAVPRRVLLGINENHLLSQRASWDARNPGVKVVKASVPSRETSLLARWGGKNVPRYSMEIEFEVAVSQRDVVARREAI
jgi:hypothetical protein